MSIFYDFLHASESIILGMLIGILIVDEDYLIRKVKKIYQKVLK